MLGRVWPVAESELRYGCIMAGAEPEREGGREGALLLVTARDMPDLRQPHRTALHRGRGETWRSATAGEEVDQPACPTAQ